MPSKFWDMEKNKQQTDIITDNFVSDIRTIIEQGRKQAYAAAGQIAIMTYWNIGRRIVEEEQQGASRAAYGQKLIPALAVRLAAEYGTGYGKRNLAYYRKFYLEFKDVEILHTRVQNLTWSHIRALLRVDNPEARSWYMKEASEQMWSVRKICCVRLTDKKSSISCKRKKEGGCCRTQVLHDFHPECSQRHAPTLCRKHRF